MIITCKSIQKTKTNCIDCQKNRIALLIIDFPSHIVAMVRNYAHHVAFACLANQISHPNNHEKEYLCTYNASRSLNHR